MIIRNTSKYPTEEVKELIKLAAKGFNDSKVCINVKNSKDAYRGRSYHGVPTVSNAPSSSNFLIVIAIGSPDKFPKDDYYSNKKYKRLTPFRYENWQEALFGVAVHELRHNYQFRHRKPLSEVDATKVEYKRLLEFRAGKGVI